MGNKKRLLELYELFPFHNHPLWRAILSHELSLGQAVHAEVQHYLRTKAGQQLRLDAVERSRSVSPVIFAAILDTYLEECSPDKSNPSHLDLVYRLVTECGATEDDLARAKPTPGNAAAMALYRDISSRGAACHIVGSGAVEHYYCQLSPRIFAAYTEHYRISESAAETYKIHTAMDKEHAERSLSILDEAIAIHGWDVIEQSVRDAFVATSLHYDGMLQAATGLQTYWDGRTT